MMRCLVLLIHIRCFLPPSLMFWINTGPGDRATIEKSWMDASERSSLAVITAQSAHSLTADVAARRLYWISDFKRVRFGSKAQMFSITVHHTRGLLHRNHFYLLLCSWSEVLRFFFSLLEIIKIIKKRKFTYLGLVRSLLGMYWFYLL